MARRKPLAVLNPSTIFSVTQGAKNRKEALAILEGMLSYVSPKMAAAVREGGSFSGSSQENAYFLYLQETQHVINQRWRVRKKKPNKEMRSA